MYWHIGHRQRQSNFWTILLIMWTGLLALGCDGIGKGKDDGYGIGCPPACEEPISRTVDQFPAWGPDSSRIAYHHIAQDRRERSGIWLLNLETGEQEFLVEGRKATWNPDGTQIAFSRLDGNLYRIDLHTDSVQRLTNCGACGSPAWSPTGDRIAFDAGEGFTNSEDSVGTWLMDPDGSNKEYLRHGSSPSWSPDGHFLALPVTTDGENIDEIARFDLETGDLTILTNAGRLGASSPAWSPTGDRIAWYSLDEGEDPDWGIWTANADGSAPRPLIRGGSSPSWSPDGSRLVFQYTAFEEDHPDLRDGQGVQTLGIANADGSDLRPLTRLSDYMSK